MELNDKKIIFDDDKIYALNNYFASVLTNPSLPTNILLSRDSPENNDAIFNFKITPNVDDEVRNAMLKLKSKSTSIFSNMY